MRDAAEFNQVYLSCGTECWFRCGDCIKVFYVGEDSAALETAALGIRVRFSEFVWLGTGVGCSVEENLYSVAMSFGGVLAGSALLQMFLGIIFQIFKYSNGTWSLKISISTDRLRHLSRLDHPAYVHENT